MVPSLVRQEKAGSYEAHENRCNKVLMTGVLKGKLLGGGRIDLNREAEERRTR